MAKAKSNATANLDLHILRAASTDARAILEVVKASWLATYPNIKHRITEADIKVRFAERMTPEAVARRALEIREMPMQETQLTANIRHSDRKRTVIGVCTVTRGDEFNELRMLYVHPDHVGIGVGSALFEAALQFVRTDRDTFLQVATYNKRAHGFYLSRGFVFCEVPTAASFMQMSGGKKIPTIKMVLYGKAASK